MKLRPDTTVLLILLLICAVWIDQMQRDISTLKAQLSNVTTKSEMYESICHQHAVKINQLQDKPRSGDSR